MRAPVSASLLVLLLSLLSVGCARTIVVDGIPIHESRWNQAVQDLSARAGFDLGCPPNQLRFTLFRKLRHDPVEVGVMGCGRRAMYIRPSLSSRGTFGRRRHVVSDSWVLSSVQ